MRSASEVACCLHTTRRGKAFRASYVFTRSDPVRSFCAPPVLAHVPLCAFFRHLPEQ